MVEPKALKDKQLTKGELLREQTMQIAEIFGQKGIDYAIGGGYGLELLARTLGIPKIHTRSHKDLDLYFTDRAGLKELVDAGYTLTKPWYAYIDQDEAVTRTDLDRLLAHFPYKKLIIDLFIEPERLSETFVANLDGKNIKVRSPWATYSDKIEIIDQYIRDGREPKDTDVEDMELIERILERLQEAPVI